MSSSDIPQVNPNMGGRDRQRSTTSPDVNPNQGGERQPHPHNNPKVNPNYGGEDMQRGDPEWRKYAKEEPTPTEQ